MGVQQFATSPARVRYTATVRPLGGADHSGTISVSLPAGFVYDADEDPGVAGDETTLTPPAGPLGPPAIVTTVDATVVTWTVSGLAAGTEYELSFPAFASLRLGTGAATASATLTGITGTSGTVPITVVEPPDTPGTPGTAPQISGNTLYLSYISAADDVDLYRYSPSPGAQVGVRLSHVVGDADLVLYGPPSDTAADGPSPVPTRADGPDVEPLEDDDGAAAVDVPEALPEQPANLHTVPGEHVAARSLGGDGVALEGAEATNADLVQVSSYKGATEKLPYVLRVRETTPTALPACAAYSRSGGTPGVLAPISPTVETLILLNEQRLGDTFGGAAGIATLKLQLAALAAHPTVNGAVVSVEGDPAVAAAYQQWNTNPCDPVRANDVVQQIVALVDRVRRGDGTTPPATQLRNVIVVGADDIVPMARLADTTRLGNETEYAPELGGGNEYHGALATSHVLSDDPYGDVDPIPWLNRRLYVPDLAVGRLVESPDEISTTIQKYLDSEGVLGTDAAYVAGYDFMVDGSQQMAGALSTSLAQAGGTAPTVTTRLDPAWTSTQLQNDLATTAPDVGGVYADFSHREGQSAAEFTGGQPDRLTPAQLAAALPDGARVVFSMGCHSGLNVSNAVSGESGVADFAQAVASGGGAFVTTTGYGYGDQVSVGLHERLMVLFAQQLDGAVSLGGAVELREAEVLRDAGPLRVLRREGLGHHHAVRNPHVLGRDHEHDPQRDDRHRPAPGRGRWPVHGRFLGRPDVRAKERRQRRLVRSERREPARRRRPARTASSRSRRHRDRQRLAPPRPRRGRHRPHRGYGAPWLRCRVVARDARRAGRRTGGRAR